MDNFTITHKGWFFYIIPIYLDMREPECPGIMTRHWAMDPLMNGIGLLVAAADWVSVRLFDVELGAPVRITGEIGANGAP